MSKIKSKSEIDKMRAGGKILREVLKLLVLETKPDTPAAKLDGLAGKLLKERSAEPSFLNYQGFPNNICISLNEELVHGTSGTKLIRQNDLVSFDLGVKYQGLYTDAATSFICGKGGNENAIKAKQKIMEVCKKCLNIGIKMAKPGNTVGDLGAAIQKHAEAKGYSVVRKLVGHGVGYEVHEEPRIPNYGNPGEGEKFKQGMCIAIEPMICEGGYNVKLADDGWTFITPDGKLSCHFEHTVVIGKKGAEIMT